MDEHISDVSNLEKVSFDQAKHIYPDYSFRKAVWLESLFLSQICIQIFSQTQLSDRTLKITFEFLSFSYLSSLKYRVHNYYWISIVWFVCDIILFTYKYLWIVWPEMLLIITPMDSCLFWWFANTAVPAPKLARLQYDLSHCGSHIYQCHNTLCNDCGQLKQIPVYKMAKGRVHLGQVTSLSWGKIDIQRKCTPSTPEVKDNS